MFDWLATRPGRLAAFFLLYVTEGLPLGYTATFVATLMRREGVSPSEIGTFVAALYLPWSFKWAAGPVVDLVRVDRFGARRTWIVAAQLAMAASLVACAGLDVSNVALFTAAVVFNNVFGAVQDVAIDALAVDSLAKPERGLANGLMFAGAAIGSTVGGTGALLLLKHVGFAGATLFVGGCLVCVLAFVSLGLREPPSPRRPALGSVGDAGREVLGYLKTVGRAFFGSATGAVGFVFALLPAGGYALSLPLQSSLAVELGLSDDDIGLLGVVSTCAFASACVAGGRRSDRIGRLRSLAVFIALTTVPTLYFAYSLQEAGWILPVDPKLPGRPVPPGWLLKAFWTATILFSAANGLMYGTRTAFFMDLCDRRVGATQFTAYMALLNLVISYTSAWQGRSIERFGYPTTLAIDAGAGLACLGVLALVPLARRFDARRQAVESEGTPEGETSGGGA